MADELTSLTYGPPFLGMSENPMVDDGRCILSVNYIPRGNRLRRRYGWNHIAANVPARLGLRAFGTKRGDAVLVGVDGVLFGTATPGSNFVMASRFGTVTRSVTNETPRDLYSFAAMGGYLYGCAGSKLVKFDGENLTCAEVVMEAGAAAASRTYLQVAPPAKCICSHLGRMWYAGLESSDIPVFGTLANDVYYTDDLSWMTAEGRVNFKPWHILFSDAAHPERVQSLNNFAVEDNGNFVVAIHSCFGGLLILTQGSTWFLSGTDATTWRLDKIGNNGCVSPSSVSSDGDAVYWLGPDAIFYMTADMQVRKIEGLDWIWTGDSPMFAALLGRNESILPNLRLRIKTDQTKACGICDHKQRGYLLSGVLYNYTTSADFGIWVDEDTKFPSLIYPCPTILGSAGNTDAGSVVSDIIAYDENLGNYIYSQISGRQKDDDEIVSRIPYRQSIYLSAFRPANAYVRATGARIFSAPQDVQVGVLSWERSADRTSPAGDAPDAEGGVPGDGTTNPDRFSDDQTVPRFLAESATTGNKWLTEASASGWRWLTETPGQFLVPVLGHGRALAVSLIDYQEEPSPILGLSLDVKAEGM